ncbi:MAG: 2Fe-2S iron-sulfur cluster-binding protein [Pseudoalteromonas distincta]
MPRIHKSDAEPSDLLQIEHLVRIIAGGDVHYLCRENETVLQGMLRLGCKGIRVGCLGGGCGVCKIRVRGGEIRKIGSMSRTHISVEEEEQKIYLACRVSPITALDIEILFKKINTSLASILRASDEREGRTP